MLIVRFSFRGKVKYGTLVKNVIYGLKGSPFTHFKQLSDPAMLDGSLYRLEEVKLLAPCRPSKIICTAVNYRSHAEEMKLSIPSEPLYVIKPSTAVIGPEDTIVLPHQWKRVDYEGELGIVIGTKTREVPEEKAREYIIGYTCVNDVTERYVQMEEDDWFRAKAYDTFAPLGPCIQTELDPNHVKIETYLNLELQQSSYTSDLIFGVFKLLSFIAGIMTLLPGDVIATGTPPGVGCMNPGDVVEVRIEKIGMLRNFVVSQD